MRESLFAVLLAAAPVSAQTVKVAIPYAPVAPSVTDAAGTLASRGLFEAEGSAPAVGACAATGRRAMTAAGRAAVLALMSEEGDQVRVPIDTGASFIDESDEAVYPWLCQPANLNLLALEVAKGWSPVTFTDMGYFPKVGGRDSEYFVSHRSRYFVSDAPYHRMMDLKAVAEHQRLADEALKGIPAPGESLNGCP